MQTMEKDEVEDRKRLLARLEKEREILQILEEVSRHLYTHLLLGSLSEYCFSGGHDISSDVLYQHFAVSVPIHVPSVDSKIISSYSYFIVLYKMGYNTFQNKHHRHLIMPDTVSLSSVPVTPPMLIMVPQ